MRHFTYIYTLTDPRDGLVHYVGRTGNPVNRRYAHRSKQKTAYSPWHQELLASGLKPIFEIVEELAGPGLVAEQMWMQKLRDAGHPIVNALRYRPGRLATKVFRGVTIKSAEQIKHEQAQRIQSRWRKWWNSLTPEQKSSEQRKKLQNGGKERMIAAQKGRKIPRELVERRIVLLKKALAKPSAKKKMRIRSRNFWDSMSAQERSNFSKKRFEIAKQKGRTGFIKVVA